MDHVDQKRIAEIAKKPRSVCTKAFLLFVQEKRKNKRIKTLKLTIEFVVSTNFTFKQNSRDKKSSALFKTLPMHKNNKHKQKQPSFNQFF